MKKIAKMVCKSAALLTLINTNIYAQLDGSKVLIVYAEDCTSDVDENGVQDSLQVAQYYQQKRNVPSQNIVGISGDNSSYSDMYNTIFTPIKNKISSLGGTDSVDVILLSTELPFNYKASHGTVSLDSLLIGLNNWDSSGSNINYRRTNPYLERNPTFGNDNGNFDHSLYKLSGTDIYLVTRLDTPRGVIGAMNLVDQALYGEKFIGTNSGQMTGTVYVDSRQSRPYGSTREEANAYLSTNSYVTSGSYGGYSPTDHNIAYTQTYVDGTGFPFKWQLDDANNNLIGTPGLLFHDGTPAESAPDAFLYAGWYGYDDYRDVFEWLPGSVACDLNSSSLNEAQFYNTHTQNWGTQALMNGVTCVSGAINEPYTNGATRPNILTWGMLNGFTYAEASSMATPYISWMVVSVGDPLYRPINPSKAIFSDTQAPVFEAGYPEVVISQDDGYRLNVKISDANGPEVAYLKVDYGTDTNFGQTVQDDVYFRQHTIQFDDVPSNATIYYQVTLTDPAGNQTQSEVLSFNSVSQTPYNNQAQVIPGVVEMEFFDEGGEGIAYSDRDRDNVNRYQFRPDEAVELGRTIDNPLSVKDIQSDEWLEYTVVVQFDGMYSVEIAHQSKGGTFHLEIDGQDITGPIESETDKIDGKFYWTTTTVNNISLTAGEQIIRFVVDKEVNSNFPHIDKLTFSATLTENVAPVAQTQNLTLEENSSLGITLLATDANQDPLSYELITDVSNGILTGTAPDFTYTPNAEYVGNDSLTFRAFDGEFYSEEATINIVVTEEAFVDTEPPSSPAGLAGQAQGTDSISITWDASTDNVAVTGYRIFRNSSELTTTTVPSYTDTNLNSDTSYEYRISAFDGAGNESLAGPGVIVATEAEQAPPSAGDDGVILIDFGASASEHTYAFPGWNTAIVDNYIRYTDAGPAGVYQWENSNSLTYNFQGVKGLNREFQEGEEIVVHWYNNSDEALSFTPLLSLDDENRKVSAPAGTWQNMSSLTLQPGESGTTTLVIDAATTGNYDVVNINMNESSVRGKLVCDKIELFQVPSSSLLIDFGATAAENSFELPGWNTALTDTYIRYSADGPGGVYQWENSNGNTYNFQGVSGATRTFAEGEDIQVTWYNRGTEAFTFTPLISFDDANRKVSAPEGTWYPMDEITIQPGETLVSSFVIDAQTTGDYSLVNINMNELHARGIIIVDKIELHGLTGGGNLAPVASFTVNVAHASQGQNITFDSSSSEDFDGSIASYAWDFGDGNSSTAANPNHVYSAEGEYTISLTVTDDAGESHTTTNTITVYNTAAALQIVDFGGDASSNQFGFNDWTNVFYDTYTEYATAGPGGTWLRLGNGKSYNFQGVSGSAQTFAAGDQVLVTWYNDSTEAISFTPKVSFNDTNRRVESPAGTWYDMTNLTIAPGESAITVYTFDSSSAGSYSSVNVNMYISAVKSLICDKIQIIQP
ncbi:MAG: TIGR03790 family protein [Lentisphaeria bacterium]|nr:TIGR03790 family protein [Lentisphaeria bacterium]